MPEDGIFAALEIELAGRGTVILSIGEMSTTSSELEQEVIQGHFMTHVDLNQINDVFHISTLTLLETSEVTAQRRSEWVKVRNAGIVRSPVRIDFSNEIHGDREIDEFTVGHADFEGLG